MSSTVKNSPTIDFLPMAETVPEGMMGGGMMPRRNPGTTLQELAIFSPCIPDGSTGGNFTGI